MNLILSSSNLKECARNLDDRRLKKQLEYLVQLCYTVCTVNKDIESLRNNYSLSSIEGTITRKFIQHPLHTWALASILNSFIIMGFAVSCHIELARRNLSSRFMTAAERRVLERAETYLIVIRGFVPLTHYGNNMLVGEEQLYKHTAFNELSTYAAYRKYSITRWKQDLSLSAAYKKDLIAWGEAGRIGNKPRKPNSLRWGRQAIPKFASEELTVYRESLYAAQ